MSGRIFAYARVSSKEQHLDRQVIALKQYVAEENILTDKASGKDLNREAYRALKGKLGLRSGDVLYITSLDRLSRNKEEMKQELQWFKENGIVLKVLDLPTSLLEVPEGQQWIMELIQTILIEVISSMAEQERLTIRKRQREGIDAAKASGKHLGRTKINQPERFPEVYASWKAGQITARQAMAMLQLKRTSFYRIVKEYEADYLSEKVGQNTNMFKK